MTHSKDVNQDPEAQRPEEDAADAAFVEMLQSIATTIDTHSQAIAVLEAQIETQSQTIAVLEARLDSADMWNAGLVKLVLVQEFKSWQHWGMTQQQIDKTMTDWKRDKASAEMAFDYFLKAMPQETQKQIASQRKSLVEMLMEYAGHDPTKGN